MFEQLPDVYVGSSSKHKPTLSVKVSSIDDTNDTITKKVSSENTKIQLSLSTERLMDGKILALYVLLQ